MNESGIYYPAQLTAEELDHFLARGWYRMGQGIFTTHYIVLQDFFHRVYWLRYELAALEPSGSWQKIFHINRNFSVEQKEFHLTDELESLYALYKTGISFEPASSVQHWLYDEQPHNIYNTHLIEIRDNGLLIAAGIYDRGNNSMAGIMNFYHPAYKKYSPGKYLMLLKIKAAIQSGMQWYYPGYIVHNYPKFDYKLFAGKKAAELFVPELNEWYRYNPLLMDIISKAAVTAAQKKKDTD